MVTPCVGVWIETPRSCRVLPVRSGHTLRGCVDWNLFAIILSFYNNQSHPAWVCGLKQYLVTESVRFCKSHPAWVCGLKPNTLISQIVCLRHTLRGCVDWNCRDMIKHKKLNDVTPCVGVWIETLNAKKNCKIRSHTLRGCVDWNGILAWSAQRQDSHTLRGCVDWNLWLIGIWQVKIRHTLRGCVDWNNFPVSFSPHSSVSHPAWVCGLKLLITRIYTVCKVTPCVGVWIETLTVI